MSGIGSDLWAWFEAALGPNEPFSDADVAKVNPDELLAFLAGKGLRITFDTKPAPEDTAFDGQYEDPVRALTARERDVLCRIIGDLRGYARHEGERFFGRTDLVDEWPMLAGIRDAIDPRGGD